MQKTVPISLHHEVHGSGPGIVLAHGFAGSARNFRAQVRSLAKDHRVLTYDARGHARSAAPSSPGEYSMQRLVSDMETLLDRAEMSEPVVVAGLSMGAATALEFALAHPQRVRCLILASYPPGREDPASISFRAEAFAQAIDDHGLELAGERFIWGPESGLPASMVAQVRAGFLEHTAHGLSGVLRGVLAKLQDPAPLAEELARTGLPTLLLHGERDGPSVQASHCLAGENPMVEARVIPDAGHVVNLDQSRLFNEALQTFLRRR